MDCVSVSSSQTSGMLSADGGVKMSALPLRETVDKKMSAWRRCSQMSTNNTKINMSSIPILPQECKCYRRPSVDSSMSASTAITTSPSDECSKESIDNISNCDSAQAPDPLNSSYGTAQASSPTRSDFCCTFRTASYLNSSLEDASKDFDLRLLTIETEANSDAVASSSEPSECDLEVQLPKSDDELLRLKSLSEDSFEIDSAIEGEDSLEEIEQSRLSVALCLLSPQNKISRTFDNSRIQRTPIKPNTSIDGNSESDVDLVNEHFLHDDSLFPRDEAWGSMAGQNLMPSIIVISDEGDSYTEFESTPYFEFGVPFKAKKYYDDADSDSSSGLDGIIEVPLSDCSSSSDSQSLPCYDVDFDTQEFDEKEFLTQQQFSLSEVYSGNSFPHISHDSHTHYSDATFKPSCMFPTAKRLGLILTNEYSCNKKTNNLIKLNASVIDTCDVQTDDEVYFDMRGKTLIPSRYIYGDGQFSIRPTEMEKYCHGAKAHMSFEHVDDESVSSKIQRIVEYCSAKKRRNYLSFFCDTQIKDIGNSELITTMLSATKQQIEETEELLQEAQLARSKTRGNESAASRSAKECHSYSSLLELFEDKKTNLVRKANRSIDKEFKSLLNMLELPEWVLTSTLTDFSKHLSISIPVASLVSGAEDKMGRLQPHVDSTFKALFCTTDVSGQVIANSIERGTLCLSGEYCESLDLIRNIVEEVLPKLCCLFIEVDDQIADDVNVWAANLSTVRVVTHQLNSKALACELAISENDVTLLVPSTVQSVTLRRIGHGWQTVRGDDFTMEQSIMATTTACVAPSLSPLFQ